MYSRYFFNNLTAEDAATFARILFKNHSLNKRTATELFNIAAKNVDQIYNFIEIPYIPNQSFINVINNIDCGNHMAFEDVFWFVKDLLFMGAHRTTTAVSGKTVSKRVKNFVRSVSDEQKITLWKKLIVLKQENFIDYDIDMYQLGNQIGPNILKNDRYYTDLVMEYAAS